MSGRLFKSFSIGEGTPPRSVDICTSSDLGEGENGEGDGTLFSVVEWTVIFLILF